MACSPPAKNPPIRAPAIAPATGAVATFKEVEEDLGADSYSFRRKRGCFCPSILQRDPSDGFLREVVEKASEYAKINRVRAEIILEPIAVSVQQAGGGIP